MSKKYDYPALVLLRNSEIEKEMLKKGFINEEDFGNLLYYYEDLPEELEEVCYSLAGRYLAPYKNSINPDKIEDMSMVYDNVLNFCFPMLEKDFLFKQSKLSFLKELQERILRETDKDFQDSLILEFFNYFHMDKISLWDSFIEAPTSDPVLLDSYGNRVASIPLLRVGYEKYYVDLFSRAGTDSSNVETALDMLEHIDDEDERQDLIDSLEYEFDLFLDDTFESIYDRRAEDFYPISASVVITPYNLYFKNKIKYPNKNDWKKQLSRFKDLIESHTAVSFKLTGKNSLDDIAKQAKELEE